MARLFERLMKAGRQEGSRKLDKSLIDPTRPHHGALTPPHPADVPAIAFPRECPLAMVYSTQTHSSSIVDTRGPTLPVHTNYNSPDDK